MTTKSSITPAAIHYARILDVDISNYTVTVATEFAQKPLSNISFAVPYLHPYNGEGIYFMPEVGSVCWLCEPSDGNMPFILAWAAAQKEGDFRAHRQDLNPGDIYLGTRDENFMILRRGGVVQIGATNLAQRIYLPVNNIIRDFCENYELHTLGGDLTWNVTRVATTTDGKRPGLLTLAAREFANDPNPIATLKIGSHDPDSQTILTFDLNASGQKGASNQISLQMDKSGNVSWQVQGNLTYKVNGNYNVAVTGTTKFDSKGDFIVSGNGKFKVTSDDNIDMKSKALANLEASGGINLVSSTKVGNAIYGVVIMSPGLLTWLTTHTHLCAAPSSPSGPPVPVLDTSGCTAQKLKSE